MSVSKLKILLFCDCNLKSYKKLFYNTSTMVEYMVHYVFSNDCNIIDVLTRKILHWYIPMLYY